MDFKDKEQVKDARSCAFSKNNDVTNKCKVMSVESFRSANAVINSDVSSNNCDVISGSGRKRPADDVIAGGEAKKVRSEAEKSDEDAKKGPEKKLEFAVPNDWE